jgi:PadR family transcriptional regulator PadR
MNFDDLLTGFVRLHIRHHAAGHEVYGRWMLDELANQREGRVSRKFYKATRLGMKR